MNPTTTHRSASYLRARMARGGLTRPCRICGQAIPTTGKAGSPVRFCAVCVPQTGKAKSRATQKLTPSGRASKLLRAALTRAQQKGLPMDITHEWIKERLVEGVCAVTGLPFVLEINRTRKHPRAPSLDRIDSTKGYTQDNVRVVLWAVNAGCMEWGLDEYLAIAGAALARRAA